VALLVLFTLAASAGCSGGSEAGLSGVADGSADNGTSAVDASGAAPDAWRDAGGRAEASGPLLLEAGDGSPDASGTTGVDGSVASDAAGPASDAGGGSTDATDGVVPTATTRALCTSVALSTSAAGAKVCPGGGAGPICYECLFGGDAYNATDVATAQGISEAGNYAVTVKIGGSAAGQTQLDAEANRVLLAPVSTSAGQSLLYQFIVNVRAKEGQPDEDVAAGYPGLDLYFSGTMSDPPEVSAIGYALASSVDDKPLLVYIASDSTACDQTDTDYAGWGQMLPEYFNYPVDIANYADSGESSGSFLGGADKWGAIHADIVAGNWVLIQFGHNDGNTTSSAFQANITQMVTDTKAKGATPILVCPPARAIFSGSTLSSQSSLHCADTQAVASAQNVAYIDLTAITTTWYNQLGPNGWQIYHALGTDKTHTNALGATKIAGFVSTAMATQKIGPYTYLR